MEKNSWKILAIVFICLFLIETFFIGWIYKTAYELQDRENECTTLCYENEECLTPAFDDVSSMCYHYDFDMEIIYSRAII